MDTWLLMKTLRVKLSCLCQWAVTSRSPRSSSVIALPLTDGKFLDGLSIHFEVSSFCLSLPVFLPFPSFLPPCFSLFFLLQISISQWLNVSVLFIAQNVGMIFPPFLYTHSFLPTAFHNEFSCSGNVYSIALDLTSLRQGGKSSILVYQLMTQSWLRWE